MRARRSTNLGLIMLGIGMRAAASSAWGAADFTKDIRPVLEKYCWDCHADGANKGNVAFDQFKSDQAALVDHELWWKVLRNLRAELMPPPKKPQPDKQDKERIEAWIKSAVFKADPQNLDPGRVTVRRLNRVEYRNTVRDLLGVDFDTEKMFPPDDAGHGFDNMGDGLTLPPMLLEKYLAAAKSVVTQAVPAVPYVPAERVLAGRGFRGEVGTVSQTNLTSVPAEALALSYYAPAFVTNTIQVEHAGRYRLLLDFAATERFVDNQFDYNKCRLVFKADGQELHRHEYAREGTRAFHHEFDQTWKAGEHALSIEVEPLTPDQKQVRSLTMRIDAVTVRGPMEEPHWVRPKNYERFFPRATPSDPTARRQYTREILEPFVVRAYRRPAEPATLDRLVALAESTFGQTGKSFEEGIIQAMTAVLASPRFLFREEGVELSPPKHPWVDEYALASRLSYFLWSSMPDDELLRLAG